MLSWVGSRQKRLGLRPAPLLGLSVRSFTWSHLATRRGHCGRPRNPASVTDTEGSKTMRVFVVGGRGAIVTRLVPQLSAPGHEMVTRESAVHITQDIRGA